MKLLVSLIYTFSNRYSLRNEALVKTYADKHKSEQLSGITHSPKGIAEGNI